ncbi:MAG: hypothetical protein N2490_06060 [Ignavibacteria bacterium]|nr:hypothetical protein [Ignavibacteria bacterium]
MKFEQLEKYLMEVLHLNREDIEKQKSDFFYRYEKIKVDLGSNIYENRNLKFKSEGIFFKQYRGFLYLSDGYRREYYCNVRGRKTYLPKFHIYECETIFKMRYANQGSRYIFSNEPVRMKDKIFLLLGKEAPEEDIFICNNCLKMVNDPELDPETTTDDFCRIYLNNTEKSSIDEIPHYPQNTLEFLSNFRLDPMLKILTHKEADVKKYKNIYENEDYISQFLSKYQFSVNRRTIDLIKKFFYPFGYQYSSKIYVSFLNDEINFTWNNEEVKDKILYEGKNPCQIMINGIKFSDEIEKFKFLIELRNDRPNLTFEKLLKSYLNSLEGWNIEFENRCPGHITAFTDVYNFFNGLEIVIEWLRSYSRISNKLKVTIEVVENCIQLTLRHINSVWQKDIRDLYGGDFQQLLDYWFCICDLTILLTDVNGKRYKIDTLNENIIYDISKGHISQVNPVPIENTERDVTYIVRIPYSL